MSQTDSMISQSNFHVNAFHYRLEPLVSLLDASVMGYELLAGKQFCPAFDLRGWRFFYAYLITEVPRLLKNMEGLLFINLDGEHLLDVDIMDLVGHLPKGQIVLEWTEHSFHDGLLPDILASIARLKKSGFMIAVDDIGSGVDGMGRAISCKPHFAKIDGALLHHARKSDPKTGHLYIKGMVESLQSSGCKVLLEMIETHDDMKIALETGADFGQGYLWTKGGAAHA